MQKAISVALLFLAWFFLHNLWAVTSGLKHFNGKADVAVILGNTVMPDGSLSPWLKGRVDEALRLYKNGQVKKIFASGGIDGDRPPEGDVMRRYLMEQGVKGEDVIADNNGNNSYLTAKDFMELNAKEKFNTAVVVTSFYHVVRCEYIIKKLGFKKVYGSTSDAYYWNDWYGLTREFLAFYKYMIVY